MFVGVFTFLMLILLYFCSLFSNVALFSRDLGNSLKICVILYVFFFLFKFNIMMLYRLMSIPSIIRVFIIYLLRSNAIKYFDTGEVEF